MHILASALSCNPAIGSEALVGFKTVQTLAQRHEVTLVSAMPCIAPEKVDFYPLDVGICSFNDVTPEDLCRFEHHQKKLLRVLNGKKKFDVIHRITPSSIYLPTKLAELNIPLVCGPVITAPPPPVSFQYMLQRPYTDSNLSRWTITRLRKAITRRIVESWSKQERHLREAKLIITGNSSAADRLISNHQSSIRQLTYAGVEHDYFTPQPSDFHLKKEELQLLWVGRMVPYKGLELLLLSLAEASKRTQLHLRVVGSEDPVYGNWCRKLAENLGIARHVSFEPPRAREMLPSLYQEADVFCFTTLCDTYGIALLEAMSSGCTVIVSDVAGAGEIVNGQNGIKIPLTTPDEYISKFSEHLARLAAFPEERKKLGAAAREHVILHHDWDRIGSKLLSIYDDLEKNILSKKTLN